MQCLWLENKKLALRQVARPQAEPGEALVRVHLAGVCGTDLQLLAGIYPFQGIVGHEFVGVVERADGHAALTGQRVVGEINVGCGDCVDCRQGRSRHCAQRTVLGIVGRHGAHAHYLALPVDNLIPVPDSVSDRAAVFCEPLAAACQILEQVPVSAQDRVLLVGAGRLGLLIAQVLARTGCTLRVVARHDRQKDFLRQQGIALFAEDEIPSRWADVAVEASGNCDGFHSARGALRPGGTLVLKSTYHGKNEIDFSSLVVDEITLIGSRCGPFRPALSLLSQGLIDTETLIEDVLPLAQGPAAYQRATQAGALKLLLDCR